MKTRTFTLVFLWLYFSLNAGATKEVKALVGDTVLLPCRVDTSQCGALHSVKWYRDTSRIYVFSQAGFNRAEGNAVERMKVEYTPNESKAVLRISPVEIEDEATYKCEITYLEVRENCDVVQIVKLQTLVKPEFVRMIGSNGVSIGNASMLGPLHEGTSVEITCEANGGKPIPKVTWLNGSTEMSAVYSSKDNGDGVGTGISKLSITLTRGDLGARFVCRVESDALDQPMESWITADVNVKPTKLELSGLEGHAVQGSNVVLTCDVFGARPAAEVRWFNNSVPITSEDGRIIETERQDKRDGTFTTRSSLKFVASRWENGQAFHCYAENTVIRDQKESSLHDTLLLEVMYPPVVTVSPRNITTNESANILLNCFYFANPTKLDDVVWSKDGKNLTLTDSDKYEGGDVEAPPLIIKNVTRDDMGEYTCILKNMIGSSESEGVIFLDVHYPPTVEVLMVPETPVKAIDRGNVTLICNVVSGNPSNLMKVIWYLGGELLKELPECNYTTYDENGNGVGYGGKLCTIDPSIMALEEVEEGFAGNYTCKGMNIAGWGPESEPNELIVYYPPGPAKLTYFPSRVIKKGSVTLHCSVEHPGRPESLSYVWYKGNHIVQDVTSSNWTIYPVTLATKTNYTCLAVNEGGNSTNSTVFIDVLAPPAFILSLIPYQGVLMSSNNISLTCRVECSPLCSITWYKDGHLLNVHNNPLYYIKTSTHLPDMRKNDFESIESTLVWNMTSWPNQQLDRTAPNSNYTCQSSSNGVGSGVNSTIEIAVDYPPENLTVSNRVITVVENHRPEPVTCGGKGHPSLTFLWKNSSGYILSNTNVLSLGLVERKHSGGYTCEATNKHGSNTITAYLTVQYPPECEINNGEYDDNPALVCSAQGVPQEIAFIWKIQGMNESISPSSIRQEGQKSYLILEAGIDTPRKYLCYANNSVGISQPCEIAVTGISPWWKRFDNESMIFLIAVIIGIIVCVIIVCIIIICICRRKRSQSKYNSHVELEEREKPDGYPSENSGQQKWPLKPGVLVHISAMRSLNNQQVGSRNFKTTQVKELNKYKRSRNKVYERLERLKDRIKYGDPEAVPVGIYHSPNGVVTFKKFRTPSPVQMQLIANPRKRKKPGQAPNATSTGDKERNGGSSRAGSKDPLTVAEKEFYENLPFHGMQNPPNKPVSIITPIVQGTSAATNKNATQRHNRHSYFPPFPQFHETENKYKCNIMHKDRFNSLSQKCCFDDVQNNFNIRNLEIAKEKRQQNPLHSSQTTLASFSFTPVSSKFKDSYRVRSCILRSKSFTQQIELPINTLQTPGGAFYPLNWRQQNDAFRIPGRKELALLRRSSPGKKEKCRTISPPQLPERKSLTSLKSDRNFASLDIKKHRCYSPTFYSLRCKKHGKRRTVVLKPKGASPENPRCTPKENRKYTSLTSETSLEKAPVPTPRCKKHHIYQNIENATNTFSAEMKEATADSSDNSSKNFEISVTEALIHSQESNKPLHTTSSQELQTNRESLSKVKEEQTPNLSNSKTLSDPGSLRSLEVDPLLTLPDSVQNAVTDPKQTSPTSLTETVNTDSNASASSSLTHPNQTNFYTLATPHYKQPSMPESQQMYSATIPHQSYKRTLFPEQSFMKSGSFSLKPKQKKHFQIPLQKCHSFKYQSGENYFQPIKNHQEESYMQSAPPSNSGFSSSNCSFKDGEAQENDQNSIRLQYPRPLYGRNLNESCYKSNGIVYADLDIYKSNCSKSSQDISSSPFAYQKDKPKTEYATLSFRDVGKEIDV